MPVDPLAPLLDLHGVAGASEQAREALGRAHRHKANLRGWPRSAAESALRAARASAILDGGSQQFEARVISRVSPSDPVLAGALRVAEALEGGEGSMVTVWQRAPLQALARLHALAASDLVDDDALGRPRGDVEVAGRVELVVELVTGPTQVPAPVLAAVAHGELLALAPFGSADGVVARAVSRLVTMSRGLDPHGLGVPEVYWMRHASDYRAASAGFASGQPAGISDWLVLCCRALRTGAQDALSIADAAAQA